MRRSKYNFPQLKVGDTFKVKPIDLNSMFNSLRFHNKFHKRNVKVEVIDEEKEGDVIISIILKRTK